MSIKSLTLGFIGLNRSVWKPWLFRVKKGKYIFNVHRPHSLRLIEAGAEGMVHVWTAMGGFESTTFRPESDSTTPWRHAHLIYRARNPQAPGLDETLNFRGILINTFTSLLKIHFFQQLQCEAHCLIFMGSGLFVVRLSWETLTCVCWGHTTRQMPSTPKRCSPNDYLPTASRLAPRLGNHSYHHFSSFHLMLWWKVMKKETFSRKNLLIAHSLLEV